MPAPTTPQRRWLAISLATVVVTISFWGMAYGIAVLDSGTTPAGGTANTESIGLVAMALAVGILPVAFILAAWVSRRPDWPIGVLSAMGLAIAVGLPLLMFRNPLGALLAGTAAGAVQALALPPGMTWHNRAIAAAIVSLVVLGGLFVPAAFVLVAAIGPALPFMAMGVADQVTKTPLDAILE